MSVQQRGGNALPATLAERELFVHTPVGEEPKIFTGPIGGGSPVPVSGGGVTANYLLPVRLATPDTGPGSVRPIALDGGSVGLSGVAITTINSVAATGYDSAVFGVATTAWTDGTYQEALMISGTVEGDKRGRIAVIPRSVESVYECYQMGNPPFGGFETQMIGLFSEVFDGTDTTYQIALWSTFPLPNDPGFIGYYTSLHILVF